MSKRTPIGSIHIPPPKPPTEPEPIKSPPSNFIKEALRRLSRDLPADRERLHAEQLSRCDNLGVFIGRTTPTDNEVAAMLDGSNLVERIMGIFSEQLHCSQTANNTKRWLPEQFDVAKYVEGLSPEFREVLIGRMCAAIELTLAEVWRDSVKQPFTTAGVKKAEKVYSERGRRQYVERKSGIGMQEGGKKKLVKFRYRNFVNKVCLLGNDEWPRQENVAVAMGYRGPRQLNQAMFQHIETLKREGHSTHHYKPVVAAILSKKK